MQTLDPRLRTALGLVAALLLGVPLGLVLGRLWPWIFAELALGVALAAGLVHGLRLRLDGPLGRRVATAAGVLALVGVLVGRYLAARSTGVGPLAYLETMLTSEPVFATVRLGFIGNVLVLIVQLALIVATTRVVGAAMSTVRGRGTPRALRVMVAEQLAAQRPEASIREALRNAGVTDPRAQADALVDGYHLYTSRPC